MQMQMRKGMSYLLRICYGAPKFLVNSMIFAFAMIGSGTNSLAAFTFVFAFAPMEAPQSVYKLLHLLSHLHAAYWIFASESRSVHNHIEWNDLIKWIARPSAFESLLALPAFFFHFNLQVLIKMKKFQSWTIGLPHSTTPALYASNVRRHAWFQ